MRESHVKWLYIPRRSARTRALTVVYGLLIFLWLSPEDNTVWTVTLLGVGLSLLLVGLTTLGCLGGQLISARHVVPGASLLGALVGLGASICVTGLMFFKNALHAHLFLDFPPGMLLATLARAPGWALAGGLAGLGIACLWWALERK
jgi:hypothetical protein